MTVPRSIDIHFSHSFAVDGPGHTITPAAGLVWFDQQSSSDATALIVDQKLAPWEHDGVIAGTTRADSTGVLAGFLYDITTNARDQELGLLQVDMEPLTFHATCIEKLPWHTCVELTWKHFQRQDEEQWAKYRVLMHTNSHAKLAVLTIDTDTIPCIGVRILDEMDGLFLNTGAPQTRRHEMLQHFKIHKCNYFIYVISATSQYCISLDPAFWNQTQQYFSNEKTIYRGVITNNHMRLWNFSQMWFDSWGWVTYFEQVCKNWATILMFIGIWLSDILAFK